jgi:hypothetical protein
MASTLLLDTDLWDLMLDADGNIAQATEPYSLAQDAASAIKTFLGECFWDTTIGIPYQTQILGQRPPIALLKQQLIVAALTVPTVVSAQAFILQFTDRTVVGQVQVVGQDGQASTAQFTVSNPQGGG